MKKTVERLLQILILLGCFTFLVSRWFSPSSNAQLVCNGLPEIRTNTHPNPYFRLSANTWITGTQVAVKIYDNSTEQFNQINDGILSWNSKSTCSLVQFGNGVAASGGEDDPIVPANELWIVRSVNTQVFPISNASNQMISAYIRVWSQFSSNTENALRNLLRHE